MSIKSTELVAAHLTRKIFIIQKNDSWQKTAAKIALWFSCFLGVGLLVALGTYLSDRYHSRQVSLSSLQKPKIENKAPLEERPKSATPSITSQQSFWTRGRKIAALVTGSIALAAAGYLAYQYGPNLLTRFFSAKLPLAPALSTPEQAINIPSQNFSPKSPGQWLPSKQDQLELAPLDTSKLPSTLIQESPRILQSPTLCQALVPVPQATASIAATPNPATQLPQPSLFGKIIRPWISTNHNQLALVPPKVNHLTITTPSSIVHPNCPTPGQALTTIPAIPSAQSHVSASQTNFPLPPFFTQEAPQHSDFFSLSAPPASTPSLSANLQCSTPGQALVIVPSLNSSVQNQVSQSSSSLAATIQKTIHQWLSPRSETLEFDSVYIGNLPMPTPPVILKNPQCIAPGQAMVPVQSIPTTTATSNPPPTTDLPTQSPFGRIFNLLRPNHDQKVLVPVNVGKESTSIDFCPRPGQALIAANSALSITSNPSLLPQEKFSLASMIQKTIHQWFSPRSEILEFDSIQIGQLPAAKPPVTLRNPQCAVPGQSITSYQRASLALPEYPAQQRYSENVFSEWLATQKRISHQALTAPHHSFCTMDDQPWLVAIELKLRPARNFCLSASKSIWDGLSSLYASVSDQFTQADSTAANQLTEYHAVCTKYDQPGFLFLKDTLRSIRQFCSSTSESIWNHISTWYTPPSNPMLSPSITPSSHPTCPVNSTAPFQQISHHAFSSLRGQELIHVQTNPFCALSEKPLMTTSSIDQLPRFASPLIQGTSFKLDSIHVGKSTTSALPATFENPICTIPEQQLPPAAASSNQAFASHPKNQAITVIQPSSSAKTSPKIKDLIMNRLPSMWQKLFSVDDQPQELTAIDLSRPISKPAIPKQLSPQKIVKAEPSTSSNPEQQSAQDSVAKVASNHAGAFGRFVKTWFFK